MISLAPFPRAAAFAALSIISAAALSPTTPAAARTQEPPWQHQG